MKRMLGVAVSVVLLTALALALSFWRFPFWWFEKLGKASLSAASLGRDSLPTPRGPLVYWSGGEGPTLVLLHGANDQAGAFGRIVRPLAARHRLVVPDLPGHGESSPAEGPLSVSDLLQGVERLVARTQDATRITLIGNSLGGYLAMLYAARHPELVEQVVLLNGAAVRSEPGSQISLLPTDREQARQAVEALSAPGSPRIPDFVLDGLVRRAPRSPLARLLAQPLEPGLALDGTLDRFSTPVTLIWGVADRYLPVSYAEGVLAQLPAARLERLEACGHVPQRECPEKLLEVLQRVLQHPPAPRPSTS